jgi:transposase-like protein
MAISIATIIRIHHPFVYNTSEKIIKKLKTFDSVAGMGYKYALLNAWWV